MRYGKFRKYTHDEDGNLEYVYSLRYSEFIALNTAVIQRQQEKINSLESRMAAIEEMLGIQNQHEEEITYQNYVE